MRLIKISQDHFIIVDDSEVNIDDCYYDFSNKEICQSQFVKLPIEFGNCKKITHSTEPLESIVTENSFKRYEFISLQEVEKLIGEVDVEKKAERQLKLIDSVACLTTTKEEENIYVQGFYNGYNQALEDNKEKKYTLDDLKTAITQGFLSGTERLEDFERVEKMILENIQQQTEWEVYFDETGQLKLKQ